MALRPFSTIFFRNVHLLGLATVVVLVAGGASLRSLPRLEDPVIAQRNPLILTPVPGASAERVEALVSKPLEDALSEVAGIKTIQSTSRSGISVLNIELQDDITEASNDAIFSLLRDEMEEAARSFPPEALPPVLDEKRGAVAFTLLLGVAWEGEGPPLLGLLGRHAAALADRLRGVPGTELVRVYGGATEEFRVELDPAALAGLGLSVGEVAEALREADTKSPAGVLHAGESRLAVEIASDLRGAERLAATPLRRDPGGTLVRVGDVATIERGWREPTDAEARSDGRRAVYVAARVAQDQRVDRWTTEALKVVEAYRGEVGRGVVLDEVFAQNDYTSERLGELALNLLLGAVVVVVVVLVTMGWRSALITGSALPLTAAAVLFLVSASGGAIHQMSIFGMIIALGLLIDNAIVTTDEIRARMVRGEAPSEAVGGAVRHLFVPLLSSSLTTIFAFAPILLLPGNAGDFISSIGGSVTFAISASFLLSMTLIAAFAGRFGRSRVPSARAAWWRGGVAPGFLVRPFERLLGGALAHPWRTLGLSLVLPLMGFFAASRMGVEFFPRTDRNMFDVRVWLPENASLAQTAEVLARIEADLRERPGVTRVHWIAGQSFPSVYYNLVMRQDNAPAFGQLVVETGGAEDVDPLLTYVQTHYNERFPEARIVANQFAQGPPATADVEVRILGEDLAALQEVGERVRLLLAEDARIQATNTTIPRGAMKVWFEPNPGEVEFAQWDPLRLAGELRGRLDGLVAATVLEDLESLDVRVRLPPGERSAPGDLRNLAIAAGAAGWLPLETLGEFVYRPVQGAITRRDRERVNTIQGFVVKDALPIEVTSDLLARLAGPDAPALPPGVRLEVGGEAENQANAVGNLTLYLPILVVLTIGVLVLSFRSVRIAGLLFAAAFLAVGCGLLATSAAGMPLSFNTILGSLGLVGLAFNASIIVLAAIRADPAACAGDLPAMRTAIAGCGRHLTSTTLTTIGGFLPLLLFVGGDFWPPLAIVLVGGVGGSTLLALFFTPALYRRFHTPAFSS
jgi:multidrug efflux pump subunit AcrB